MPLFEYQREFNSSKNNLSSGLANRSTLGKVNSLFLVLVIFVAGYFVGTNQDTIAANPFGLFSEPPVDVTGTPADGLDLSPLWQAWSLLETKFVTTDDGPTSAQRIEGLISGLAESYGDPYTQFFNSEDLVRFNESVDGGSFSGVGIEIGATEDGLIRVVAPLKNTPAEAAGVKSGDIILAVDGVSTVDVSTDEVISLIRGLKGTTVELTLARKDKSETFVVPIVRQTIEVPVMQTSIEDNVFIISIYTFSADLDDSFKEALSEYEQSDTKGLVIDLRNNPGGYLSSAINLGSWFTDANDVLVREQSERTELDKEYLYRSKGYQLDVLDKKPVVVLVNQGSASASEILAGIIKDYKAGVIVGENTFGKGSVQELMPLSNSSALKITTARWFTPKGSSISEGGLEPDVFVEDDPDTVSIDEQLVKAIELVSGQ